MLAETEGTLTVMLPGLLAKALQDHSAFASKEPKEDGKEFAAYQSACKASLAHIEQLLKLARWVDGRADDQAEELTAEQANADDSISQLIARAKYALKEEDC